MEEKKRPSANALMAIPCGIFCFSIGTLPVDAISVFGSCVELDLDLGADLVAGDIHEGDLPVYYRSVDGNVIIAYFAPTLGYSYDWRIPLISYLHRDSLQPVASIILDCAIDVAADGIVRIGSWRTGQAVLVGRGSNRCRWLRGRCAASTRRYSGCSGWLDRWHSRRRRLGCRHGGWLDRRGGGQFGRLDRRRDCECSGEPLSRYLALLRRHRWGNVLSGRDLKN